MVTNKKILFISIVTIIIAVLTVILLSKVNELEKQKSSGFSNDVVISKLTSENESLKKEIAELQDEINDYSINLKNTLDELEETKNQLVDANSRLATHSLDSQEVIIDTTLDPQIINQTLLYYEGLRNRDSDMFLSATWYDNLEESYDWADGNDQDKFPKKIKISHIHNENYIDLSITFHSNEVDYIVAYQQNEVWKIIEGS